MKRRELAQRACTEEEKEGKKRMSMARQNDKPNHHVAAASPTDTTRQSNRVQH